MSWLALEPLLVARLVERLDEVVPAANILTAPEIAAVTEQQQVSPAVYVIYRGSRVNQVVPDGTICEIEQAWGTVVAVRNVKEIRTGAAARADAGLILDQVFAALAGWRPEGFRALRPIDPPASGYTKGFQYHPLEWTTRVQKRGNP